MSKYKTLLASMLMGSPLSVLSRSQGQSYIVGVSLFAALYFIGSGAVPEQTAQANSALWFVGALSVGLTYTFGFTGLATSLGAAVFSHFYFNHPLGVIGLSASILFTASLSLTVLLPYYRQEGDGLSNHLLGGSKETGSFIALSILASAVSTGLYVLCINIASLNVSYGLSEYLSFTLSSTLALVCLCPLLTVWKRRYRWPEFPGDPKEYAAWCICLIVISFLTLAFGRGYSALYAVLVIWSTARFSWFGACLGLGITTLFVSPSVHSPISELSSEQAVSWIAINAELLGWLSLSTASLYFASLLADRRRVEKNLEARVHARTRELDQANKELQREIGTRHAAEVGLKKTNKRYRALIETAGIPVIVINDNYLIEHWNGSSEAASGYKYEAMLGKDFLSLCIPKEQHEALVWRLNKASASNTNQENVETSLITSSDTHLSMLWNINFIADEDLEEHGQFLLIGQDISNIRQTQDQLHYLAHFDSLTGAANRRLFEDRCRQSIETAKRYDAHLALLSIDIDHFKKINDTLGHDGGDEFLVALVKRFQECVRKEDTIARLGGDEFAILLPNVNGQDGADVVARHILEEITKPITIKGSELIITSSIGITLCPDDGANYEDLLKNADMAMYRAKNAGRNNIQFYCADMNSEMLRQVRIERELRIALSDGQFELHYQPLIDTKSGEVVALEALTRWQHPERGLILPDEFLNVADQTGLLQEIGKWAINQLCTEGRELSEKHFQELPIAFNLTRKQYNHPSLLKMLEEACEKNEFNPKKLILEVAENTITQGGSEALKVLKSLKSLGCVMTVDSFGTGSSSLSQLNSLPIDIIKIDRSFIASCLMSKKDKMIVEALLAIAKQLNIKSFATGVETPAQEFFLQKNGCHYVQGFLYSEALPIKPLIAYLSTAGEGQGSHSGDQITLPFGQQTL